MIQVKHLTKRFGGLTAVDNLSFTVREGEAVALWGANGAGKTTTVRCLLNLTPYEGQILMNGIDVAGQGKQARNLVGFVPQELTFHDDLTVSETITFYGRLKKIKHGSDFSPLLKRLDLIPHIKKPIRDLSGGLKQRLALALALLSDPPILLLDEPTANLDIRARDDFLQLLAEFKKVGKTMLFSSHRLDEVTALADRVLLLEAGKLVVDAPPYELEKQLGWQSTLHIYMSSQGVAPAMATLTHHGLVPEINGRGLRVLVDAGDKGRVFQLLHDAGVLIDDFTVES